MRLFLPLCLALSAFGQQVNTIDANAVLVTITSNITVDPDTAILTFAIAGDGATAVDQVRTALGSLGTKAEYLGANPLPFGPGPTQTRVYYMFRVIVPAAELRSASDQISQLRRTLLDTPFELQPGVTTGLAVSPAAFEATRTKTIPDMIGEARRRAQLYAQAGGVTLGGLVSVGEFGSPQPFYNFGSGSTITFGLIARFSVK